MANANSPSIAIMDHRTSGLGDGDDDGVDHDFLHSDSTRKLLFPRRFLSTRCNSEPKNSRHQNRGSVSTFKRQM